MNNKTIKILILALLIAGVGLLSIYSSTYQKENKVWQQQIVWLGFGVICYLIVSNTDYRKLLDATYFLYGFMLFLLTVVYILGIVRLGAQRWLKFGGFNFQPSEMAKIVMIIFLARYFSQKSVYDVALTSRRLGIWQGLILPFIFTAIPMFLIVEQPDLGTALMLLFIFIAIIFSAGIKFRLVALFIAGMLVCLPVGWHFLRDYQRDRLMVFLNPDIDPLGAGYTLIQSKIAIGSGGFLGKGFLSGTQGQLHFLPESHTDFIFATFAEEWGFWGCIVLLVLYFFLIREGLFIAERTSDHFGKILAYGISLALGIQIFVNVAMTMGLMPVVGVPLPLMSYGGSSLVVTFVCLGILASIEKARAVF